MAEETATFRILYDEAGVKVGAARQGIVVARNDKPVLALPWQAILDISPEVQGRVQWLDCCVNCGDVILDDGEYVNHEWALAMDLRGQYACKIDSWSRHHGGIVPAPNLIAVAERARPE